MGNQFIDGFMAQFKYEGLTFDDISLLTQYADFLPDDSDISTRFSRNIKLNIPFVSAAMDTVTESEMAIAMAKLGGIGVIHKNLDIPMQADEVRKVKQYLNGFIRKPIVFRESQTVQEMLNEKNARNYSFSGFPIVNNDGKLVGIVTARDIKFLTSYDMKIADVMTAPPVTAPEGSSLETVFKAMLENKVGKLPTVDANGFLTGLYSFHDVRTIIENMEPAYNRDAEHRLRAAAAVSPYDEARASALAEAGVDAFVIDTAHGHSKGVRESVKLFKAQYPDIDVVAGNVATFDAQSPPQRRRGRVKVGSPGSYAHASGGRYAAVTPYTSIQAPAKKCRSCRRGINSRDVARLLAVGASSCMMGSVLAGTLEGPGEKTFLNGRRYVVYRGMGSLEAMKKSKGSRERYGQADVDDSKKLVPQGVEGMVPYRGTLWEVIHQFAGGLKYSLGYCGARDLETLRNTKLIRVSGSALKKRIRMILSCSKDAPNYMQEHLKNHAGKKGREEEK